MPSVSKKQHNLMEAVAHNPGFAKKVGIPQKVGEHFHKADKVKGKKFAMGGAPVAMGPMRRPMGGPPMSGPPMSGPPMGGASPGGLQSGAEADFSRYLNSRPGLGMKKGGHVKHANELKGKAKETKSIAKEEMKALKRGHAPKEIMEHERAEHKAMGYKHGGKVETPKKGFAMGKGMGHGRKAPHSTKGEEGDTKLKGFGMAKGTGHGRSVTRAPKPKDETKTKGFAMKKGGHVKKHEKHMKRGGMSAKRPRAPKAPKLDASALLGAASASPPPSPPVGLPGLGGGAPMGGAPMGGAPGMKKGGHVAHHAHHGHGHQIHHHHHYAKGGSVRAGIDEKAQRGHTRGKQVKMASGGHVGSHPSRRGDGMAHKGHTRCKIV